MYDSFETESSAVGHKGWQNYRKSKKSLIRKGAIAVACILIIAFIVYLIFRPKSSSSPNETDSIPIIRTQKTEFCIVSATPTMNLQQFKRNYQQLNRLLYLNWKAYYYRRNIDEATDFIKLEGLANNSNIKFVKYLANKGENYYDAIQNRCAQNSVIILMDEDQYFVQGDDVMLKIDDEVQKGKDYYLWAYSIIDGRHKIRDPSSNISTFKRSNYFSLQGEQEKQASQASTQYNLNRHLIYNITTHVRIFKRQFYSHIPFIDLTNENETFYETPIAFLLPLIEMRCQTRVQSKQFNTSVLPGFIKIDNRLILYTQQRLQITLTDLQISQTVQIGRKMEFPYSDKALIQQTNADPSLNMPKLWGSDAKMNFLQRKITNQSKIPKIVHQIILHEANESALPSYKVKIMNTVKKTWSQLGYQYKIWFRQNMTKEKFPITFKRITQIQIEKANFPQTSELMVEDLMKAQILYNQGGFYFVQEYEAFKSLDHLRKYRFIGVTNNPITWGDYISTFFIGAQKQSPYIKRILESDLVKGNGYYDCPHVAAKMFASVLQPKDFYQIKILSPSDVFPANPMASDARYIQDKCSKAKMSGPVPSQPVNQSLIDFNDYYTQVPCSKLYPNKYGTMHWVLRST